MRFTGETKGLEYIKGKIIKDPSSYTLEIIMPSTAIECKKYYDDWIHSKRYMFSPREYESIKASRILSETGLLRDHYINVFVDWAERKPRCRAIIIVESAYKKDANNVARQIDIIGGAQTFGGSGLSNDGKEPPTHYFCSWNCSASEYEFFESIKDSWWKLFDGYVLSLENVLKSLGLKKIYKEFIFK